MHHHHEVFTWDQYTQRTAAAIGAPAPRIIHLPTDLLMTIDAGRYHGALGEIFRYHGVYSSSKLRRDVPEYRPATSYEDAAGAGRPAGAGAWPGAA